MDSQMESTCAEWCRSHYWQLQEKRGWRYSFHESVMVRYYEEANLDPTLLEPLVEFLKGDGWQASFTVHNKPMDMAGWKTRDVWYETRDGDVKEANKLKRTRLYHAVYKEGAADGGDGPWTVEDGCKWKVSHTFNWKVAELPEVPQGESGVQWRLQGVTRDDETGLWSCVLERRETVRQDVAEYGTAKTVFEERSEEQHLGVRQGQVDGAGKKASAGGGVLVRRQVRKNEDCTSDVTNETITEKSVAGAVEEETRTPRGTRTTTVNRNQGAKAQLPGDGMGSVRNEKTDGGLWNQTITVFAAAGRWVRRLCRKTLFLHEHVEIEAVERDPGFTHEVAAGGGVVREKTVTRNDEGGFDVETRTREEQSVPGAVVETSKFVDGVLVTTVNRGQKTEASAADLGIGESVRNEKTDGGLVDQTIRRVSVEAVGRTGEACEQSALVHSHTRIEGKGSAPQEAAVEQEEGLVRSRRVRLTERGAWEVTDETRAAKEAHRSATGGATGRSLTVEVFRNAKAIAPAAPGVNEEVDVSLQPNEFGLVDGTVRRHLYSQLTAQATGGATGASVTVTETRNDPSPDVSDAPAQNKTVEVSVSPNDHGSYDKRVRVTQYEATEATANGGSYLVREARTVEENGTNGSPSEAPTRGTSWDVTAAPNDHGSYRVQKVKRTAQEMETSISWTSKRKSATGYTEYSNKLTIFRNKQTVPIEGGWELCSPGVSINEFGLYDGTIHYQNLVKDVHVSGNPGDGGMTYSGTLTVVEKDGTSESVPFTVYRNARGIVSSGFLAGAKNYPHLGLESRDSGTSGIKYG